MKILGLLALLAVMISHAGCTDFTQAQIDLVTQARRGIAAVSADEASRAQTASELTRLRRQRLDEAFDEDVQQRAMQESIDSDWVIEARRAYAAAIETYAAAQADADRASEVRARNLAAIDAALDRLQWMQSVQLKFNRLPDEMMKDEVMK